MYLRSARVSGVTLRRRYKTVTLAGSFTEDTQTSREVAMTTSYVGSISGAHYRSLIQNVDMPVILHIDDHVVDVNRAFADFLGYTLPEARRLGSREFVHPALLADYDRGQSLLVSGAVLDLAADYDLVRKDGVVVRARVKKSVARHNAETVVMTVIEGAGRPSAESAHPDSVARAIPR